MSNGIEEGRTYISLPIRAWSVEIDDARTRVIEVAREVDATLDDGLARARLRQALGDLDRLMPPSAAEERDD